MRLAAAAIAGRPRAALAAFALAALLAGCGSSGVVEGGNNAFSATTLTVYTDLPLLGPASAIATDIAHGEELALYDSGGHVGRFHVSIQELDATADSSVALPYTDSTSLQTANSAHAAASDLSTIAYIGDLYSPQTAISLPLNNENGILQLSPGSSYSGFTDPASPVAPSGGPAIWYPNGSRTFARLVPADTAEATAMVAYMKTLGVRRLDVVSDAEYPPLDSGIAHLVAADAPAAGVTLVGRQTKVATQSVSAPASYASLAQTIAAAHPDGVLLGASPNGGADALFRELHAKAPKLKLFAASTLATPSFLGALGAAAAATYVTSPILEPSQYPAPARAVLAQYRRRYPGEGAPSAYALYGYEAMEDVLAAIARAGRYGANRQHVVSAFFHLGRRNGVLGSYAFNGDGDTSLDRFDGYRVGAGGRLVAAKPIS